MIDDHHPELAKAVGTRRACQLLGRARATHYRRRRPPRCGPPSPRPTPPNALRPAERQAVLDLLHRPEHCDLAVAQVWGRTLDDGTYLCSQSTMHRLLRGNGESRERRRQRTHPAKKKPELMASQPNQVWSWDITKLRGPNRASTTTSTSSSTSSAATSSAGWWPHRVGRAGHRLPPRRRAHPGGGPGPTDHPRRPGVVHALQAGVPAAGRPRA